MQSQQPVTDPERRIPDAACLDPVDGRLRDVPDLIGDPLLAVPGRDELLNQCAKVHGGDCNTVSYCGQYTPVLARALACWDNTEMHNPTRTGLILRQLMTDHGNLSEGALAEATGVPQPTIHRILTGESRDPRTSTLRPLADYFAVTVAYLRDEQQGDQADRLSPAEWQIIMHYRRTDERGRSIIEAVAAAQPPAATETLRQEMEP